MPDKLTWPSSAPDPCSFSLDPSAWGPAPQPCGTAPQPWRSRPPGPGRPAAGPPAECTRETLTKSLLVHSLQMLITCVYSQDLLSYTPFKCWSSVSTHKIAHPTLPSKFWLCVSTHETSYHTLSANFDYVHLLNRLSYYTLSSNVESVSTHNTTYSL